MSIFFVFSVIFAGPRFVVIQRFCYHGNKMQRLLFSVGIRFNDRPRPVMEYINKNILGSGKTDFVYLYHRRW